MNKRNTRREPHEPESYNRKKSRPRREAKLRIHHREARDTTQMRRQKTPHRRRPKNDTSHPRYKHAKGGSELPIRTARMATQEAPRRLRSNDTASQEVEASEIDRTDNEQEHDDKQSFKKVTARRSKEETQREIPEKYEAKEATRSVKRRDHSTRRITADQKREAQEAR